MTESHLTTPLRPRILAIGDAIAATGFARVMQHVLGALNESYEVHQIGINYHGDPHNLPWKIYPAQGGGDLLGVGRIRPLIQELKPNVIFLLNDLWVLVDYIAEIEKAEFNGPVLVYCPIDSGPVNGHALSKMSGVSEFVVYTEFAAREVNRTLDVIRSNDPSFTFPEVTVIAHGVDVDDFHPLQLLEDGSVEREFAIQQLYGSDPDMENAFIVLNANRNQPRKRIDITIKGFAQFALDKPPHVKLHLHMGVEDAGWNVAELARRYGIDERLILSTGGNNLPSVPNDELNLIYNTASIGVNTSIAEGWGLVAFEHAAAGGVQIVPDHSACRELWANHGKLIRISESIITEGLLTDGFLVSSEHLAMQLDYLYKHPEELKRLSMEGIEYAKNEKFNWSIIGEIWKKVIDQALKA